MRHRGNSGFLGGSTTAHRKGYTEKIRTYSIVVIETLLHKAQNIIKIAVGFTLCPSMCYLVMLVTHTPFRDIHRILAVSINPKIIMQCRRNLVIAEGCNIINT